MRIGVDIDGVLAQFESGFAPILTRLTGIEFPLGDQSFPPVWDWPAHYGVEPAAESAAWGEAAANPEFWRSLQPYPYTKHALQRLSFARQAGHDVYFITTRFGKDAKKQTEEWLVGHGMTNPTVLISKDKGSVMRGVELDIHIDDKPENFFQMPFRCRPFLQARPYNEQWYQDIGVHRGVHKVESILQMLNFVQGQDSAAAEGR